MNDIQWHITTINSPLPTCASIASYMVAIGSSSSSSELKESSSVAVCLAMISRWTFALFKAALVLGQYPHFSLAQSRCSLSNAMSNASSNLIFDPSGRVTSPPNISHPTSAIPRGEVSSTLTAIRALISSSLFL